MGLNYVVRLVRPFARLATASFLAALFVLAVAAQSVDRAQVLSEIINLQNQIKATTDPAQVALLQEQLNAKYDLFLAPAPQDVTANADFLKQADTGIIRILPRERFQDVLTLNGWGAYYSFTRLTHLYGQGSDLELQQGRFVVGFAGFDFGFMASLGDVKLETLSIAHPAIQYLANFVPPLTEAEARAQYARSGAGFEENSTTYRNRFDATLNTTFVVRSVQYELADVLVAFRTVRQDSDGSLILLWKRLKWFPTPEYRTNSFLANVSAASYKRAPLAPESIVAAFGSNLAAATVVATNLPLPTSLGDITITIFDSKGKGRAAPLFAVAPNQINFQVPPGTAVGPIDLYIDNRADYTRQRETLAAAAVNPGIFTANANGSGPPAGSALRISDNGQQFYDPVARYDIALKQYVLVPIDLGNSNDQVFLVAFGTGLRGRSSLAEVKVSIGGVPAQAYYAGSAEGFVGLDQLNVLIPHSLAGRGDVEVVVTADGRVANTFSINLK